MSIAPRPRMALRAVLLTLTVGALALSALASWHAILSAREEKDFPAPGRFVALENGVNIHLYCTGSGGPAVILEAGTGEWSAAWFRVQEVLSRTTTVCSYDRAGSGWSADVGEDFSADGAAENLAALLARSGIEPPYVLAGHSFGGLIIERYARLHPDRVAGLAFVDALPPQFFSSLPRQDIERYVRGLRSSMGRLAIMARLGLVRLAGTFGSVPEIDRLTDSLPEDWRIAVRGQFFQARFFGGMRRMTDAMEAETISGSRMEGDLPDVPAVVIVHDRSGDLLPGAGDPETVKELWQKLQKDRADAILGSRLVVATGSGHFVQIERPELVAEEISRLVERAMR